jgi:uncharacterized membrane protein YesL
MVIIFVLEVSAHMLLHTLVRGSLLTFFLDLSNMIDLTTTIVLLVTISLQKRALMFVAGIRLLSFARLLRVVALITPAEEEEGEKHIYETPDRCV